LKATVTSWLSAGTEWFTAKRWKVFLIRVVKYRSIKTIKLTNLYYCSSCRGPESGMCVQLRQWTHRVR
jgi:hypothetical protein